MILDCFHSTVAGKRTCLFCIVYDLQYFCMEIQKYSIIYGYSTATTRRRGELQAIHTQQAYSANLSSISFAPEPHLSSVPRHEGTDGERQRSCSCDFLPTNAGEQYRYSPSSTHGEARVIDSCIKM